MKFSARLTKVTMPRFQRMLRNNLVMGIITAGIIAVAVWGAMVIFTPKAQRDLGAAKTAVGRHMILPTNEEPTLAVVADKAKVTNKFLASKAQNGDEILVYTQNQMAIIYRPGVDKIVAVAVVSADSALAESQKATITVLNGSNDAVKTQKVIAELKSTYPDMAVTDGGVANKHDFTATVIIDNSGEKDYLVDALAQLVGGARGIVPISEATASTDLMIIVGKDS